MDVYFFSVLKIGLIRTSVTEIPEYSTPPPPPPPPSSIPPPRFQAKTDYKHFPVGQGLFKIPTVMLRFSARGAYLLLVPQGRAFIRDRALISVKATKIR